MEEENPAEKYKSMVEEDHEYTVEEMAAAKAAADAWTTKQLKDNPDALFVDTDTSEEMAGTSKKVVIIALVATVLYIVAGVSCYVIAEK